MSAKPSPDPRINFDSFVPDVFDRIPTYQQQIRYLLNLIIELEARVTALEPPQQ